MQIIGTILCIFINSPLLLRIPQKSALLFDNTLCPIPYGAAEYKLSNTVNSDIFDAECAFAAEFRTFFSFFVAQVLFIHPLLWYNTEQLVFTMAVRLLCNQPDWSMLCSESSDTLYRKEKSS